MLASRLVTYGAGVAPLRQLLVELFGGLEYPPKRRFEPNSFMRFIERLDHSL